MFAVCCRTRTCNFLRLLADRILIFSRLELLAHKAQFNFFSPFACSCGARTCCTTSSLCIIFGLYCPCTVRVFHSFKLSVLCANLSPHTFYHSLPLCSSQSSCSFQKFSNSHLLSPTSQDMTWFKALPRKIHVIANAVHGTDHSCQKITSAVV